MRFALAITALVGLSGAACDRQHDAPGGAASASVSAPTSQTAPTPATPSAPPAPAAPASPAAQAPAAQAPAAPAPKAQEVRPLLWAAEKAGVTTYLFGTMHMGVDAATQLPPIVWAKLDAAPAFAMEADTDDPALAAMVKRTDHSLHGELGDAYWAKLESALGPAIAAAVDHLPPMVPATLLATRGLPITAPMDKVLSARARGAKKPIVFLEAATHQLALLAKWMDARAIKMMLDTQATGEKRARAMLSAYVEGNEREIATITASEKAEALHHGYTAAEYDREIAELLYERNAAWIAAIEKLHRDGGSFVAVGAMHLVGPRSVLDHLTRRGFRVTRVAP